MAFSSEQFNVPNAGKHDMISLGSRIDRMHAIRELKRKHEETIKELEKELDVMEFELIEQMDKEGVTRSTGAAASVSITESVRPSVENWDDFYRFIHRYKYYHLLDRRPSVNGCRELFETKGKIPGVVPFTKRKINLRSIT